MFFPKMTVEDYQKMKEENPDMAWDMLLGDFGATQHNLDNAHSDLDAYKAENRELKAFKKKILGPECQNKECPDYDGEHPYHLNEMVKAHDRGQEKQQENLKAAYERITQLQTTCGSLTDELDIARANRDEYTKLSEHCNWLQKDRESQAAIIQSQQETIAKLTEENKKWNGGDAGLRALFKLQEAVPEASIASGIEMGAEIVVRHIAKLQQQIDEGPCDCVSQGLCPHEMAKLERLRNTFCECSHAFSSHRQHSGNCVACNCLTPKERANENHASSDQIVEGMQNQQPCSGMMSDGKPCTLPKGHWKNK